MSSYQGPTWAAAPPANTEWTLIEIKSGVEMARHRLNGRPFTLLGRDADACPIALQHESCSRLHARIAFDAATGVPWLRDLQSTHGTTVNKKKLPPIACGKVESSQSTKTGARGVILYPCDILQFGASTRIYSLEGPEEFARGAKKLLEKQQQQQQQALSSNSNTSLASDHELMEKVKESKQQKEDDTGVSWGIDMEDHEPQDDDDDDGEGRSSLLPANLDESKIPEKHRKEWDRLRALRYKLDNVQQESERILRKGGDNLTQGQQSQLQRNQERQDALKRDIREKESALYRKLFPDKVASSRRQSRDRSAYAEEDEVEDRTRDEARRLEERLATQTSGPRGGSNDDDEAEDEESLRRKRLELLEKRKAIQDSIARAQQKSSMLQARIDRLNAAGDGEEAFFVQNDLDIANDALSKGQKELGAVDKMIGQTERLLKIVNPKIDFNEETRSSQNQTPTTDSAADLMPAPSIMPAPPAKRASPSSSGVGKSAAVAAIASSGDNGSDATSLPPPPPPKRPRVLGPSMPPPPPSMSAQGASGGSAPAERRPRPLGGTLDVLSASRSSTTTSAASQPLPKPIKAPHGQPKTKEASSKTAVDKPQVALTLDDAQHDQWVKPKDQDGSGKTKLNAKFAGRY